MPTFPPTLNLDTFKQEMNISDASIAACGFLPEDLQDIYADYYTRYEKLEMIKTNLFPNI